MYKKVYIAEKPDLGRKIADHIGGAQRKTRHYIDGGDWVVTWCIGHLYQLYSPDEYNPKYKSFTDISNLPIIPDVWKVKPTSDKKEQVDAINKLVKRAESVVNVGDPDKEGQYLVDLVIKKSGFSGPVYRLWPDDLSPSGLTKSFSNIKPNSDYRGLSLAAEFRGYADWLIGMNFSRLFTAAAKKSGYQGVISAGRVQSPTLSLIVKRCRDIVNFKPTFHYGADIVLSASGLEFKASWVIPDDLTDDNNYLLNKEKAIQVANESENKEGKIILAKHEPEKIKAPLPFNLSKLQSYASSQWKFGAKKTLDVVQKLYDSGFLTYPRTDCCYLSEGDFPQAKKILDKLAVLESVKKHRDDFNLTKSPRCYNDSQTTAHTAIVPTLQIPDLSSLSSDERLLYEAVAFRFAAQFLRDAEVIKSKVVARIGNHEFKSTSRVITFTGWQDIEREENVSDDEGNNVNLSAIREGSNAEVLSSSLSNKKTSPPSYFTEGTLIEAMASIHRFVDDEKIKRRLKDSDGIGTEATRASIIERLKAVRYISINQKGHVIATKLGNKVVEVFPNALRDPSMTALWESILADIGVGKFDHNKFLNEQVKWLSHQISEYKEKLPKLVISEESKFKCNVCQRPMFRRSSRDKKRKFWSCSGYPDDCKNSLNDFNGAPLYPIDGHGDECSKCENGVMMTRVASPKGKPKTIFLGCSNFPDCKNAIWPDRAKKR